MKRSIFNQKFSVIRRWLHLAGQISFPVFGGLLLLLVFWAYVMPAESKTLASSGTGFEYTMLDSNDPGGPVYDWVDISSSGTLLSGWTSTDDGYAGAVPLGFSIDYYGNIYDELFVGSNGYVSFGQGYGTIPGGTLPSQSQPNNDIALFGSDMYLNNYGSDSMVHYETLNSPTRFVLQFTNLYYCCSQNTSHNLEMILFPNGDILVQYQSLNGTSTSYVGIENQDGTAGLSYGETLADSLAIQYYYPSGLFLNPPNLSGFGFAGATVSYTLQLANQSGMTDTFDLAVQPGNNWATTLSITETGELGDGETMNFDVWVDIPGSADPGDVDLGTILATSIISPTTISDTAEIQTTAASGDYAYVAVANYDYVALVDSAAHIVVDTIDLGPAGCDFPWRVSIPPNGETVWVSCRWSNNVIVLDHNSNAVVATINVPQPYGIGFRNDSAFALVGSNNSNSITIVDTATYFTSNLATSGRPTDIAVHPFFTKAYATNKNGTTLEVVDLNTFSITNLVNIGQSSEFVAISRDGLRVYTSNRGDYTVSVIDTLSEVEIARIPVGIHPLDLSLNADGSRLYVALENGDVAVINTATLSTLSPLTVDPTGNFDHPWGTDTTCLGDVLFVTNSFDGSNLNGRQVAVVDLSGTPTVTTLVPMPDTNIDGSPDNGARGIAVCPQFVGEGILLSPPDQEGNAALGEKVTYETTLLNFTGATDSFSLTLGSHTWPTTVTPDLVGPLADSSGITFTVEVTVPIGASWYMTDTVEVTATSVTSPSTYVVSGLYETEAFAPPDISLNPEWFTSTQLINEVTTQTLMIGNGNGVDLSYLIDPSGESGVSFFAASTELYGYNVGSISPVPYSKIVGLEDNTSVRVIDLDDGSVIVEDLDLDQYEVLDAYPGPSMFFKIESDKPVVGYENNDRGNHNTFVPALDGDPVGDEFIFYYYRPDRFYLFAMENVDVEVYDDNGVLVASQSVLAGKYWELNLTNDRVYHVYSTGQISLEGVGDNGYSTVPDVSGKGLGRLFYFGTYFGQTEGIAVFAYQTADVDIYDLDTNQLLWSSHINAGDNWWQTNVGFRRFRLESTGDVEVWAGSTEGGSNIEDLGDDISFAAGDRGREYYLNSLQDGIVIFAPFANTQVNVDGAIYSLDKDEYVHLSDCCTYYHIQSNQPVVVQTLGGGTNWNDIGSYLGGVNQNGGLPIGWLYTDPVSGTVGTESDQMVEVAFDSNGLQPGEYTADLIVSSNDPASPVYYVPVTMTVEPTANMGWVEGTVTDASSGEPMAAAITALGQPYVVYSDPTTGYYKLWLDDGGYTLEVSANNYVTGTAPINITAQLGTQEDFALVPFRPVMQLNPETIDVTIDAGMATNRVMTITNAGPAPLQFELNDGSVGANLGDPPANGGQAQSMPTGALSEETGEIQPEWESSEAFMEGSQVLIIQDTYPWGYNSIQQVLMNLGLAYDQVDSSSMGSIDLSNYELVIIPSVQSDFLYNQWDANIGRFEAYVMSGGALWLSGCTYGRLINLPGGITHQVDYQDFNVILEPTHPWVAGVPNPMQGSNASHNAFSNIGAGSLAIASGQTSGLATLVDYRLGAGRIFLTGQTLEIAWAYGWDGAPILDNSIADMFAWSPDVPWLSTDPISGTIPGYSSQQIQVSVDTNGLQPGDYSAGVFVSSNDPVNPTDLVTVTLDVQPTANMGQVRGTVTDAWTGDPVSATVELVGVYSMLADPNYNIWANAGSYSLMVYAPPEYYTMTVPVQIPAGGITIQNLALERAQPRIEWDLVDIEVTVSTGATTQATLTLDNSGPLPLMFSIHEIDPNNMLLNPNGLDGKRILYDGAHGQSPMSDYDTMIADLVAAGAVVNENTTFPITAAILANYDVLWSTCCGYTDWTFNELSTVEDWLSEGGAVLVQGEDYPSTEDLAGIYNITYTSQACYQETTTDIQNHPISIGVMSVFIDNTCSQLAAGAGTDFVVYDSQARPHIAAHEAVDGKMVVVSSEDFVNWAIDNDDNRLLALNTMTWLANPPYTDLDWLSAMPANGVIPGHGQQEVTISFDATSLAPGEYEAILAIEHNDPDQPFPVEIPVHVEVVDNVIYLPAVLKGGSSGVAPEARLPIALGIGFVLSPIGFMSFQSFTKRRNSKD